MVTKATRNPRTAALRNRSAQRTTNRAPRRQATPWLETETGKMVVWGAIGFLGVVVLAGIAGVIYETDALDRPEVRRMRSQIKALPQSRDAREAMDWLNSRFADLRQEFSAQLARLS